MLLGVVVLLLYHCSSSSNTNSGNVDIPDFLSDVSDATDVLVLPVSLPKTRGLGNHCTSLPAAVGLVPG